MLIRYNKEVCPVCGTNSKGCSSDPDSGLFFCRGNNPSSDYKFLKTAKDGIYGIYVLASEAEERSEEAKQAWIASKKIREQKKKQVLENLLSIEDRDRKFKALLSSLTLRSDHKAELIKRGLTESQIEEIGYRSIQEKQEFSIDTDRLPTFTNGIYWGASGILLPIRDSKSRILGFQVKADSGAKYRWVSSKKSPYHLRSGESPISFNLGGDREVGLCEGILKSAVASSRHGINLIGAAAGVFSNSKELLKGYLADINADRVVIYADAGSWVNENVSRQIETTYRIVKNLGYKVAIADWGQLLSKEQGDIDEIESLNGIKYLTLTEYKAIDPELYLETSDRNNPELSLLQALAAWISKQIKRSLGGFVKQKNSVATVQPKWQSYDRRKGVIGNSLIFDSNEDIVHILKQAKEAGYKHVINVSGTGSGKSYSMAELEPTAIIPAYFNDKEKLIESRIFYLSKSARNPAIAAIEDKYTELPVRNLGYKNSEKLTPLGNPERFHVQEGENPDTTPNCHWAKVFSVSRELKTDAVRCKSCRFYHDCKTSSGEGYGYISQVRFALGASKRIRSTPNAITPEMVSDRDILVVDEPAQSVEWIDATDVSLSDLTHLVTTLRDKEILDGSDFGDLVPLLDRVRVRVARCDIPEYGVTWGQLRQEILNLNLNWTTIESILTELEADIDDSNRFKLNKLSRSGLSVEGLKEGLYRNWLRVFVNAIHGNASVELHRKGLSIVTRNDRVVDALKSSGITYYLDATMSREQLGLYLGIDPEEILVISLTSEIPQNLTFTQIYGSSLGWKQTDLFKRQSEGLRKILSDRYGSDIGFISRKSEAKTGDLKHFIDARGDNSFQAKKALCIFGAPVPNVGAIRQVYEAFTGKIVEDTRSDEGFSAFYRSLVQAELIQEIGRLRANRRPDERLEVFFLSNLEIDFLTELGYTTRIAHIADYDLRLASNLEQSRFVLWKAVKDALDDGKQISEVTQTGLSKVLGKTQGAISQMAATFGGWEALKKILTLLIYKDRQKAEQALGGVIDPETLMMAESYLPVVLETAPLEVVTETLAQTIEFNGKDFEALMSLLPVNSVASFVAQVIKVLPKAFRFSIEKTLCEAFG